MTADFLVSIAGVLLSLSFSYIPGLRSRFETLEPDLKRLVMLAFLLLTAIGVYGVSCARWYPLVACTQVGALGLIELFVRAAIANQAAYLISPKREPQAQG